MDKERVIKPGDKDDETLEKSERSVDLEEMSQKETVWKPAFCECGRPLTDEEDLERCSIPDCDALLCQECVIRIDNRNFCQECAARRYHSLGKPDYKILLAIKSGVRSEDRIAEVTELDEREVKRRMERVEDLTLEERSLFGFVNVNKHLSPAGHEALDVYGQIYGEEPDLLEFKEKLRVFGVLRER